MANKVMRQEKDGRPAPKLTDIATVVLGTLAIALSLISLILSANANRMARDANDIAKEANQLAQEANDVALRQASASLAVLDAQLRLSSVGPNVSCTYSIRIANLGGSDTEIIQHTADLAFGTSFNLTPPMRACEEMGRWSSQGRLERILGTPQGAGFGVR